MKNWTTDKIIAVGLMGTFAVTIICMDIVAVMHGDMSIEGIAKELAIGLFSYMSRGLTQVNDGKEAIITDVLQQLAKKSQQTKG